MDAEKILKVLEGQSFYDFYCDGGMFDDWIQDPPDLAPSRDEVLKKIESLFRLKKVKVCKVK